MTHKVNVVGLMLALLAAGVSRAAEDTSYRHMTTGLYPLWENTGFVEGEGKIRISTTGTHVGFLNVAHAGILPLPYLYRTPNSYLKVSILDGDGPWHLSGQVGVLCLLEGASRSMFSPMYPSRLDNPDFKLYVVPVAFAATYVAADWLHLHHTVTALGVVGSGPVASDLFPGYSLVAEFKAGSHSLQLHAAEAGFWKHDFFLTGMSYRYQNAWLELRAGYFYRFRPEGTQGGPMIGLGFLL